ncbi:MAG: AmmeMemoRadiSam system protein B, partial [Bacillota bacterium]
MKRPLIILLIILLLFALSGCQKNDKIAGKREEVSLAHPGSFVPQKELYRYVGREKKENPVQGKVKGGIVPHHLLAGALIADFISLLAEQKPEVIIIVGPNHKNAGAKIISGLYNWETSEGLVKTERSIVNQLHQKGLVVLDDKVLSQEHSIGTILPFIKHYLPETKIVPIIFHHDVSLKEIDPLVQELAPLLKENAVILGSVDFSHYLTRREAEAKDVFTLKVMQDFNYTTLFRLGNDHLDSPPSLA